MREIVITKAGGTDVLKVAERADPTPEKGEIRIRVKASGINFADIMARLGMYPDSLLSQPLLVTKFLGLSMHWGMVSQRIGLERMLWPSPVLRATLIQSLLKLTTLLRSLLLFPSSTPLPFPLFT
ncbi:hypothetical protein BC829DRAFT_466056 [Chytridium lagenaria]|nr:hypothetical protein BC829DRAFT_466056 [Chytridium lagenaria]